MTIRRRVIVRACVTRRLDTVPDAAWHVPGSDRLVVFEAALQPFNRRVEAASARPSSCTPQFVGVIEQDREAALDLVGAEPSLDVPDAITGGGIFGGDVGQ